MSGLNPTLAEEGRAYIREKRKEIRLVERLVDRVEELELENKSLNLRMDIVRKAREENEQE